MQQSLRVALRRQTLPGLQPSPPLTIHSKATVRQAVEAMQIKRSGSIFVSDHEEHIVGIFTERDLVRRVLAGGVATSTPLIQVMTGEPICLHEADTAASALEMFNSGNFRHLPIVDDAGRPVGVLSVKHLVHFLVSTSQPWLRNFRASTNGGPVQPGSVDHIMSTPLNALAVSPVTVPPTATLGEIVTMLTKQSIGCMLVESMGQLVGLYGERDLLLGVGSREDHWRDDPVGNVMIRRPVTLRDGDTILHALHQMDIGDYRHIPMVDSLGHPTGIVSVKSLLRHLASWLSTPSA